MEKIWLKSYPDGMPAEIPPPEYRSLRDMLERSFAAFPERPAYANMGTSMSYAELDRLSQQFASYLQQTLGLTRGERVAIMLPNILQYPVVLCGIFRAGLVVVNVNPLYTSRELEHQLSDSGAKCIIILENFAHVLAKIIGHTKVQHTVMTGIGDLLRLSARPADQLRDALRQARGAALRPAGQHTIRQSPAAQAPRSN